MTAVQDPSFVGARVRRPAAAAAPASVDGVRDVRLDFFRGLAMFIILVAHTPGNWLTLWIPARFGFSDATEIFVFCSGMASAIAFGRVFEKRGWHMGTFRIMFRVWQVYWAHIGMFMAVFFVVTVLTWTGLGTRNYAHQLALHPFLADPATQIVGLMTLTYVPNYFDILPMYLVILAMIPLMMGLSRISVYAVFAAMAVLWVGANINNFFDEGWESLGPLAEQLWFLHLPAQYWFEPPRNTREWFFNPFSWQIIFFTGFALMQGWIPKPPVKGWLIALAVVIVLANVPLANVGVRVWTFEWVKDLGWEWTSEWRQTVIDWRLENREWFSKTDAGLLRYVQFLSLAYLGWVAAGEGGRRLIASGQGFFSAIWRVVLALILKVGQQSLAVFVFSMVLARIIGFAFDATDRTFLTMTAFNLAGFGCLVAVAYTAGWFKSQPWRKKA